MVDRSLPLLKIVELNHIVQVEAANEIVTVVSGKVTDIQTELNRLNDLKK